MAEQNSTGEMLTHDAGVSALLTSGVPIYDPATKKLIRVSPTDDFVVSEHVRLIGPPFAGSLSATGTTADNFWSVTRGSASTAVLAGGIVTLTGGTTNADWCQLTTIRKARYIVSAANNFRAVLQFAAIAAANTSTYIGNISVTNGAPQNGYCFKVDGAGLVSVQSYAGGAAVLNKASGFNGVLGATYSVPDFYFHSYEIIYVYRGVYYLVDGNLLHYEPATTVMLSPITQSNNASVSVVNGTSPASRVVVVGDMSVSRFGKETTRPQTTYIATASAGTLLKTGAGTLHSVIMGQAVNNASITIYDGTSTGGTILSVLTQGSTSVVPAPVPFGIDFYTGLFVVTTGSNGQTTFVYD